MARDPKDHGWGPYWLPLLAFLLLVEASARAPEGTAPFFLPFKVAVPLALFLAYALRGRYPELRGFRADARVGLDVAVGVAGAALWVAPFVLFDSLRPGPEAAFDPEQLGPSRVWLTLALRALGFALVTPFVEELFVRGWLQRYVEVYDSGADFRDVPIGRFSWRGFLAVVVYFPATHLAWGGKEMLVAIPWAIGTTLWYYHRKHIAPLVIVHAVTNLSIFLFVVFATDRLRDAQGRPIALWFFL
ncbi:MAG: CAAX prenyl protease-related protein [Myxococcota bacterium]